MIEFNCEHCGTEISLAPDQIVSEIFCPSCDLEVNLPELSFELQAQVSIALAQTKSVSIDTDHEKAKEMLEEPDSQETTVWKEKLAESFQAASFKDNEKVNTLKSEADSKDKKSGAKSFFNLFSRKK